MARLAGVASIAVILALFSSIDTCVAIKSVHPASIAVIHALFISLSGNIVEFWPSEYGSKLRGTAFPSLRFVWLWKEPFWRRPYACPIASTPARLLREGVSHDGLCAFIHGMIGQLAGQEKPNGHMDFAARDGGAVVVLRHTTRLCGYDLEDRVHKTVHDRHGFDGDLGIGMDLLQHLVDVDGVRLPSLFLPLFSNCAGRLGLRRCFLCPFWGRLRRHLLSSETDNLMGFRKDFRRFICVVERLVVTWAY